MNRFLNVLFRSPEGGAWEESGLPRLDSCLQDVRYAIRGMRTVGDVQRILQVTGVVRYDQPSFMINRPVATIFLPLTQKDLRRGPQSGTIVVLRGQTHLSDAAIARGLAAIDRNLNMFEARSMREFLASLDRVAKNGRSFASGVGIFGLLTKHAHKKTLASIWLLIYRKIYHA
jgi:hypothetical protein